MIHLYDLNNQRMKYDLYLSRTAPRDDARRGEPSKPVDEFLNIWSKSDSAKDKPKDEIKNRPWFIHKMVKQAIWRPMFAIGWVPRTLQMYRTYLYRYSENPNDSIFYVRCSPKNRSSKIFHVDPSPKNPKGIEYLKPDRAARIYDRNTRTGRFFERALIPKRYRKTHLTAQDQDDLRTSGAKNVKRAGYIWTAANIIRIGGNLGALYDNIWGQGGSKTEAVVMATDTAISASFIGVQLYYAFGGKNIEKSRKLIKSAAERGLRPEAVMGDVLVKQQRAYRLFKLGKIFSYSAFGLQTIGAGIKLYNELQKGRKAKLSAIADAAVDIGQGGAYSVYNYYLVRESGKLLTLSRTAGNATARVGVVKKATDVLMVSARVIPRSLLWTMRGLGVAGAAISGYVSGSRIYEGMTNNRIPKAQRRHMVISGSLGILASAAFGIGAFFITPAGLAVGTMAILIGLTLIGIQTIYDEWPSIKRTFRKGWDACRDFVNNAPSGFVHAIKTFPVPTQIKRTASKVVSTCVKIAKKFASGCASVAKTLSSGCKRAWNYVFG